LVAGWEPVHVGVGVNRQRAPTLQCRCTSPVTRLKRKERRTGFTAIWMRSLNDTRRPRCSGHKRDLNDPSPALLDGVQRFKDAIAQRSSPGLASNRATAPGKRRQRFLAIRMRCSTMLAGARFQPRYCTWKAAPTVFGDRALTGKPVTPLSPPPRRLRQDANRVIRHHPPADCDSCSTG
jgi:hypothetical protein